MKTKEKFILHDHHHDGLDRRGFLECMAWAGTGMLWTVSSGVLGSMLLPSRAGAADLGDAIEAGQFQLCPDQRFAHWF